MNGIINNCMRINSNIQINWTKSFKDTNYQMDPSRNRKLNNLLLIKSIKSSVKYLPTKKTRP